jgi:hypothetical protein
VLLVFEEGAGAWNEAFEGHAEFAQHGHGAA